MSKDKILKMITEKCELDFELTGKEKISDSGVFDSMSILILMAYFDQQFSKKISPDQIKEHETIGDLVDYAMSEEITL